MSKSQERIVKCSFCGKPQEVVKKIIAGPGVYICDECIALCQDIIEEEIYETEEVVEVLFEDYYETSNPEEEKLRIAKELNIMEEELLNFDLYLCSKEKGYIWGYNNEYFAY